MPHGWALELRRANSVILPSVVIRSIFPLTGSVNHSAPSGPVVIPQGLLFSVGMVNSVTAPVVVIRPILPRIPVNHSAPSGPVAISPLLAVGIANSVTTPVVVIRRILPPTPSVNHKAPSGPVVMPSGPGDPGTANSISCKLSAVAVVGMRPIFFDVNSVNHSAPSGPVVMECKMPSPLIGNSVMIPWVVIRAILPPASVNHSAPSGPVAIAEGRLAGVGRRNSENLWAAAGIVSATAPNRSAMTSNNEAIAILMALSKAPVWPSTGDFGSASNIGNV